jgi:hypothetical protein
LHRPLSEALKKQNSKDSNSLMPAEWRAWLKKVSDIDGYEVLAKDNCAGEFFVHSGPLVSIAERRALDKRRDLSKRS